MQLLQHVRFVSAWLQIARPVPSRASVQLHSHLTVDVDLIRVIVHVLICGTPPVRIQPTFLSASVSAACFGAFSAEGFGVRSLLTLQICELTTWSQSFRSSRVLPAAISPCSLSGLRNPGQLQLKCCLTATPTLHRTTLHAAAV